MPLFLRRVLAIALLGAALVVPAAAHAEDEVTLVLHQEPFEVAFHDLDGDRGASAGDLYTWVAPIGTEGGRTGTIVGDHQVVALPTDGPFREVRLGTSVIDLGERDTIVLGGLIPVTTPLGQIEPGTELANAIIGGTGAYLGAKGEIESVRAEDGSWAHTLSFETVDPARGPVRTIRNSLKQTAAIVDQTGDGTTDAGDLRVAYNTGTTDDGRSAEAFGTQIVVRGPGADGSPAVAFGYVTRVIGGDLLVGAVTTRPRAATGRLTSGLSIPIVGGTGQFAGARGVTTVTIDANGDPSGTHDLYADKHDRGETLVLRSALPQVATLDRGESGPSIGDQQSWVLPFTTDAGEPAGTTFGYITTIHSADDGTPVQIVAGLISLQFADGSTILVADLHPEDTALPKAADLEVTRPVLGGTGAYAGVSGELVTTLDGESGLVHTFNLLAPAE